MNEIKLFDSNSIRTVWNEEEQQWYFSVVDVCNVLAESKSTDTGAYWRKLKQRLIKEGSEAVTKCHQLKMLAPDGKKLPIYPIKKSRVISAFIYFSTESFGFFLSFSIDS